MGTTRDPRSGSSGCVNLMRRGIPINRWIDRHAGIPLLGLIGAFRSKRPVPAQLGRIGICAAGAMGDVLLLSGVVRDLRVAFPQAEIGFFAGAPASRAAAELIPQIDYIRMTPLDRPWAIGPIRHSNLDVLLDFSSWPRATALIAAMSGARCVVGFRTKGQYRHFAYDIATEHCGSIHECENYRKLVAGIGIVSRSEPAIEIPEMQVNPVAKYAPYTVFHACATGLLAAVREWPNEYWVGLAASLPARTLVLTGSRSDAVKVGRLEQALRASGVKVVAAIGHDLANVGALLKGAELVVSVNTGIMHLSAVVGAPTVSINGPNRDARWGPRGRNCVSVEAPGTNGGYLNLGWEFRGQPRDLMTHTTPEHVLEGVAKLQHRSAMAAACK